MQKNFIRNTIKCNCTPAKIRYNVLLRARLPQHSTDTGTRDSTATSAPHLISIQKPKMCHLIGVGQVPVPLSPKSLGHTEIR